MQSAQASGWRVHAASARAQLGYERPAGMAEVACYLDAKAGLHEIIFARLHPQADVAGPGFGIATDIHAHGLDRGERRDAYVSGVQVQASARESGVGTAREIRAGLPVNTGKDDP